MILTCIAYPVQALSRFPHGRPTGTRSVRRASGFVLTADSEVERVSRGALTCSVSKRFPFGARSTVDLWSAKSMNQGLTKSFENSFRHDSMGSIGCPAKKRRYIRLREESRDRHRVVQGRRKCHLPQHRIDGAGSVPKGMSLSVLYAIDLEFLGISASGCARTALFSHRFTTQGLASAH